MRFYPQLVVHTFRVKWLIWCIDGEMYPPKILYSLFMSILRCMTIQNPIYLNFLDKKSVQFVDFHWSFNNAYIFHKLCVDGIGEKSCHAPTIITCCGSKVCRMTLPHKAVFYYYGKNFIFWRRQEWFEIVPAGMSHAYMRTDWYVYPEMCRKNHKGGLDWNTNGFLYTHL